MRCTGCGRVLHQGEPVFELHRRDVYCMVSCAVAGHVEPDGEVVLDDGTHLPVPTC